MERLIHTPHELPTDKLGSIFQLQRGLMDQWVSLGKLPPYPLSLQTREGQASIKQTLSSAMEEMAEAHQKFRELAELLHSCLRDEEAKEASLIWDYTEEVSDFLHFYVEAMIQLNISAEDIAAYYQRVIWDSDGFFQIDGKCTLGICLHVAAILNQQNYRSTDRDLAFQATRATSPHNTKWEKDTFTQGSQKYSMGMVFEQAQLMWDVAYDFAIAMNFLKNNAWKQTDEETEEGKVQEQAMLGWMALMNLLQYMGHSEDSIYLVYYHKNHINNTRIKAKR